VTPQPRHLATWLIAARPKTLCASVVPVLVGTALVPRVDWLLFGCTLLSAVCIQVGTNYVNDALDFKRGADTAARLGPLRVTQAGLLSAAAVMRGAYVCFASAVALGVPLVVRGGWPIVIIGLASVTAAYLYTGGPYPLAYHGLGELFVLIFFGVVAVCGTVYVQTLAFDAASTIAGIAVGLLSVAILSINNLRDVDNDRLSNKKTLIVRLGATFGRIEIALAALLPFACAIVLRRYVPLLALPLALLLIVRVNRSEGTALNRCLAIAGALEWAFGILFVIGSAVGR